MFFKWSIGVNSNSELTYLMVAAITGLVVSLIIETVKYLFEQKKDTEHDRKEREREFEKSKINGKLREDARVKKQIKDIHKFLAEDALDLNRLRPISRILVSSAFQLVHIDNIPRSAKEVYFSQSITRPISQVKQHKTIIDENLKNRNPPTLVIPVERRYYKKIDIGTDYVKMWKTREEIYFLGTITTIGRLPDNTIVLNDPATSRNHAVIRYEDVGFVLYDFSITNPTKVNDHPISDYAILHDGNVIEIGPYLLEFQQMNSTDYENH